MAITYWVNLTTPVDRGPESAQIPANLFTNVGYKKTLNVPAIFSGAGTPVATSTVPSKKGDIYIDTAASKIYIAKAATAAADYLILN